MIVEKIQKSLTIEFVIGFLGGLLGLYLGVFILFSQLDNGISAISASLVGLIGVFVIYRSAIVGGILLIVSSIWLLISIPTTTGILAAVLIGAAGLMKLDEVRKPKKPSNK